MTEQTTVQDTGNTESLREDALEKIIPFETLVKNLNESQKHIVRQEYQKQGNK